MTGSTGGTAHPPAGGYPRPRSPARVVVTSPAGFAEAAARLLADALGSAAEDGADAGRPVSLALAGGSTPGPVYERLAEADVPWDRFEVFFGDERCVPPDDPASNYGMARRTLLDRVAVAEERIHRMACEADAPERAAARYALELPDALDVLVLGVGTDGHTASLFPASPALAEPTRRVVPARAPDPPHRRLTVTPPVLQSARRTFVLAAGPAKATAVRRALEEPYDPSGCPAQLVRGGTWILDRGAASSLHLAVEEVEEVEEAGAGAPAAAEEPGGTPAAEPGESGSR